MADLFQLSTAATGDNHSIFCNNLVALGTVISGGGILAPKNVIQLSGSTASQLVTAAQSGSILYIPQCTANVTVQLPAPTTKGLSYKFIAQSTSDGTHTCTIASSGANVLGSIYTNGAGTAAWNSFTAHTNIILSATAANVKAGDYVIFDSDGTNYWVSAVSAGASTGWSDS